VGLLGVRCSSLCSPAYSSSSYTPSPLYEQPGKNGHHQALVLSCSL
jgi:hypothetical protein